jgi:hypothetical protein
VGAGAGVVPGSAGCGSEAGASVGDGALTAEPDACSAGGSRCWHSRNTKNRLTAAMGTAIHGHADPFLSDSLIVLPTSNRLASLRIRPPARKMNIAFRIMGIAARLLLALGAVCLLLGAHLATKTQDFNQNAQRATGRVVRYLETREGDDTIYRPMVRFTTPHGDIVTFAGQLSTGSKRFAIGTEVPVVYPFGMPQQGRISTFTDNWLGAAIAGVVGLLALVAGVFIRRATRRELAAGGG